VAVYEVEDYQGKFLITLGMNFVDDDEKAKMLMRD